MGEMIRFASNGQQASGYLATPQGGNGPGVVVIQEWWGLVDHIKDVCDRFGANGFFALAPDLYDGRRVAEPDEAAKEMMALEMSHASKHMTGAVNELVRRTGRPRVGVVGFCMGGGLSYVLAAENPETVGAIVPFYGVIPWPDAVPDYSKIAAKIQGHYAELDGSAPPQVVAELESQLKGLGKDVEFFVYPGTEHAFFNDTREEVYNAQAAQTAWDRVIPFLRDSLS